MADVTSIFPFVQPQVYTAADIAVAAELPPYKDVEWDFINGRPIFVRGEPKIVSGLPAVMSWAWRALKQARYQNEIYTWNYGNEVMSLVGQQWIPETKMAEATRCIKECLTVSPYIKGVANVSVTFADGLVTLSCIIQTVYGEAELHV